MRIDISISMRAITTTFVDLNETKQAGACDAITPRWRGKVKALFLHYHDVYVHQTC